MIVLERADGTATVEVGFVDCSGKPGSTEHTGKYHSTLFVDNTGQLRLTINIIPRMRDRPSAAPTTDLLLPLTPVAPSPPVTGNPGS